MSTNQTDYGAQRLSFDYRSDARASVFNKIFYNLLPYGIYSGGSLIRLNNVSITVEPMTVIIPSNNHDSVAVKSDTAESQVINFSSSLAGSCDITKPYIILRFGWTDEEDNFMEILASSYESILDTDIILGKVNFTLNGTSYIVAVHDTFDLSKRQIATLANLERLKTLLKVSSTEPPSNKVAVSGGTLLTSKGKYSVAGGQFPENGITIPEAPRIDIIGFNTNGELVYIEGTAAAEPVAPTYGNLKVLAEINLKANQTVINGSDITIVDDWSVLQGMVAPEDVPIEDPDEHFPAQLRKITAAIHYLWTHSLVLNHDSPEVSQYQIDAETDENYPLGDLFI